MANNPALQNAALTGGASAATGRWLTSGVQADYIDIRNQLLLFAAAVDAAIAPTAISEEDAALMAQICAAVISERWPTAAANYTAIGTAIAGMWAALRSSLIAAGGGRRIEWEDHFDMGGGGSIATAQAVASLGGLSNWRVIATGSTGTIQPSNPAGEAGHPGILQLATSGVAVGRMVHMYRGSSVTQGFTLANEFQQAEFIVRLGATTNVAVMLGMANNIRGLQTNQMALTYNAVVSPNWFLACSKGGSTTTRDTGVAADVNTFHRWKIAQDTVGEVKLSFEGSVVATINDANVPTTEVVNYVFGVETQVIGTRSMDLDWCSYKSQLLAN